MTTTNLWWNDDSTFTISVYVDQPSVISLDCFWIKHRTLLITLLMYLYKHCKWWFNKLNIAVISLVIVQPRWYYSSSHQYECAFIMKKTHYKTSRSKLQILIALELYSKLRYWSRLIKTIESWPEPLIKSFMCLFVYGLLSRMIYLFESIELSIQ